MPDNTAWLLEQHLEACLSTLHELTQYAVLPQSAHYCSACLLCESSSRCDLSTVGQAVLHRMKAEWSLVLRLESSSTTQGVLHAHCPFVCWQPYREVQTATECAGYKLDTSLRSFLVAYNPSVQASANCEDVFAEIQDSIKRSGKSDTGSITNMTSVGIRATNKKAEATDGLETVRLKSEDFEGCHVRSLRASVFRPDSCPSSILVIRLGLMSLIHCFQLVCHSGFEFP